MVQNKFPLHPDAYIRNVAGKAYKFPLPLYCIANANIRLLIKDTNKRARNMKFTSMFFKASAGYLSGERKDTNKRARNMKFTSMFFKASAGYLRGERKDTNKLQIGI